LFNNNNNWAEDRISIRVAWWNKSTWMTRKPFKFSDESCYDFRWSIDERWSGKESINLSIFGDFIQINCFDFFVASFHPRNHLSQPAISFFSKCSSFEVIYGRMFQNCLFVYSRAASNNSLIWIER
jgi:hypothetical protein